jgi:hypothetical protein
MGGAMFPMAESRNNIDDLEVVSDTVVILPCAEQDVMRGFLI